MAFTADKLILFGATGDLSQRMLLPSLCALNADGLVAKDLKIIGTARSEHDDASFRAFAGEALEKYLPEDRKPAIPALLERLFYQTLDASDPDGFCALADKAGSVDDGLAIFLSTAPSLFEPTIAGLKASGEKGSEQAGRNAHRYANAASARQHYDIGQPVLTTSVVGTTNVIEARETEGCRCTVS